MAASGWDHDLASELPGGENPAGWLPARIAATPDKLALRYDGQDWTYQEMGVEVAAYAAGLRAAGVRPGDRVGLLLPNRPETVFLIHALTQVGAILVPLNTRLSPAEVDEQVAQAGCGVVIRIGDGGPETGEEKTDGRPGTTEMTRDRRWETGEDTGGETGIDFSPSSKRPQIVNPNQIRGLGMEAGESAVRRPRSAVVSTGQSPVSGLRSPVVAGIQAIVFTSGTTGRAKGAQITYANLFWSALASAFRLGVRPEDRWLSVLPLYHVGGLAVVWRSCLYGTAIVLHQRFDLARVNASLDRDGVTLISLVPTMLYRLLESRESWPDSLRLVLLGGAAATPELISRSTEAGVPVATTYGLTEAASQVATLLPDGVQRKPGSVGKPLLFSQVRVVDEQGWDCPAGTPGEVLVSGPTVMAGYDGDPAATARTIKNGELYTGDIGYLDDEGDLWLVQRRSDLIVSGGENVYPAEVEAVLNRHPAVQEVCVVGVPDTEWGQQVAAMVVLRPGREATGEELSAFCREQLAGYKLPRRYLIVAELPQTASGKVSRPGVVAAFQT